MGQGGPRWHWRGHAQSMGARGGYLPQSRRPRREGLGLPAHAAEAQHEPVGEHTGSRAAGAELLGPGEGDPERQEKLKTRPLIDTVLRNLGSEGVGIVVGPPPDERRAASSRKALPK